MGERRPAGAAPATGAKVGRSARRGVDLLLQVRGNGHGTEGADVGAARVAMGQPAHRGLGGGADDPHHLSSHFACAVVTKRPAQHPPVHAHVRYCVRLAQDVRPLEVPESGGGIALPFGMVGGVELGPDGC
jgi:hypothetical protein